MSRRGTWYTAIVVALAAVGACGDGDGLRSGPDPTDPAGPSDPEPPGPPEPPAPPPEPPAGNILSIAGGGRNVPERFTSDLWVHGGYAYTGTWGGFERDGNPGNALKIWALEPGGAPVLTDSIVLSGVGTVSDVEVSADGQVLMLSAERGEREGLYLYDLADPERPTLLDSVHVGGGLHTATFGEIGSRRYAFTAKNPVNPALRIFDVTDPGAITPAASVPIPPTYGIHDTYVREGLAFVFAWNAGVIIYDVGHGIRGGTPESPVEVSRLVTSDGGVAGSPAVHNGWWFHNPATEEARYLFIGQEGPGQIGLSSSGDIHVVDVADLANPREVATFRLPEAGAHNFWMDEPAGILYAAYYTGGVVALDVSGTLSGDLSDRLIGHVRPDEDGTTYTWGVMLADGRLYASDMLSGLWQIAVASSSRTD
ncbi:MAG TPA: hypothetical protein VG500_01160 [Gemmatimonadales bacterium]|jgi:hypothetical protein|nr:hypothetical protein [Gemmatimonadales bacterium]